MIFYPGKIYYTKYQNWKKDASPLIFVLYSNVNECHALNLHYFSPQLLIQFYNFVKKFSKKIPINLFSGKIIYYILKRYFPIWIKMAYRKYKAPLLNGILINEGITRPVPGKVISLSEEYKKDLMVQQLNENLKNSAVLIIPAKPTANFSQSSIGTNEQNLNKTK